MLWDAVSRWVLWLIWFGLVVGCVGLLGVYLFGFGLVGVACVLRLCFSCCFAWCSLAAAFGLFVV